MSPRLRKLLLLGPIAEPGKPAIGGYESANLRLLDLMRTIVPHARPLAYPRVGSAKILKVAQYGWGFARITGQLVWQSAPGSAVHFTPLCRHFLAAELLLAVVARLCGYRLTVDLRAGDQEIRFRNSSFLYRWAFRRHLSLADRITYEGEAYKPWLRSLSGAKPCEILPNFVPSDMVRMRPAADASAAVMPRLIYVGTVSEEKGVTATLRAFKTLCDRFPELTLTLVGRCQDAYRRTLTATGLLSPQVSLLGQLPPAEVERELDQSHFFMFLSRWRGEGHSNSLTEAMARGCVPIVTDYGFNRSVVSDAGRVIPDREDASFVAQTIEALWREDRFVAMSRAASSHIAANFTDAAARQVLLRLYAEER